MIRLRRALGSAACALALLLASVPVRAQGPAPATPNPEGGEPPALVRIDGHALFRVTRIGQESPERRARAIASRIARAASDPRVSPDSLRFEDFEYGTKVSAGEHLLLFVTDPDAAAAGLSRGAYVEYLRTALRRAIESYRAERAPGRLVRAAGEALAVALLGLVVLFALGRLRRWLNRWTERTLHERVKGVKIQGAELVRGEHIWGAVNAMVRAAYVAACVIVLGFTIEFILGRLPWTRELSGNLLAFVLDPLRTLWAGFLLNVPGLLFIAVLVVVVRVVLFFLRMIADAIEKGTITLAGFDAEWAWPTHRIVRLVVIAMAVVVAYPYIPGSGSDAFKGVSLLVGVLISLGSSSVVGNIIAGYTMIYRRAFRVGDIIRLDDTIGQVTAVRVLVTHVRTAKNEEVVLPNSLLQNAKVVNYSTLARQQGLILHTSVGIGYEVPWRQVEAMLLLAAERTAGLTRDPKPFVLQRALGDFAVIYELNVYTPSANGMLAQYSELHRNVLDVFNEYGVQIMTPAYEGDPEVPKVVPRDQWHTAPASAAEGPPRTPVGH